MPKFLEERLKKEYGKDSDVPYKIMNKLGFMRGSKTTTKGRAAEVKHKGVHGEKEKESEVKDEKLVGQKLPASFKSKMVDKLTKKR